jgi:hypothetical protein
MNCLSPKNKQPVTFQNYISSVSAVRKHCVNTHRYTTQNTNYTPCVSLKRTAKNCMQHSASGKANSSTAIQQTWNTKVHCLVNNSPALVPILPVLCPSIYLTSVLIIYYHLRIHSASVSFPSCCPPKIHNWYFKDDSCDK